MFVLLMTFNSTLASICQYLILKKLFWFQVFVGALSAQYEALSVEASKQTSSEEIVCCIADKLNLTDGSGGPYELAEVFLYIGEFV